MLEALLWTFFVLFKCQTALSPQLEAEHVTWTLTFVWYTEAGNEGLTSKDIWSIWMIVVIYVGVQHLSSPAPQEKKGTKEQ